MAAVRRAAVGAAANVTLFTVVSQTPAGEVVCVMGAAEWLAEAMVGALEPSTCKLLHKPPVISHRTGEGVVTRLLRRVEGVEPGVCFAGGGDEAGEEGDVEGCGGVKRGI